MLKIANPDNFRKNVSNKFKETITDEKNCLNLEKGIFNYAIKEANNRKIIKKWENPHFAQIYIDRVRSIYINLKNPELLNMLNSNEITPQTLAFMTHQEMNHEHWRIRIERKITRDASKFTTNVQASTDMFTCRKCKSKRSTFYELQTRSADEPATIFITCLDCGKQSKRS
jgi:DNA-directed RNA polymerase subunit M/transcription elongation factor TFIIS